MSTESAQPGSAMRRLPGGVKGADHTVGLPDGRKLGYRFFGDPDGAPVLYFHGLMLSRLHGGWWEEGARRVGARIVAIDRPGVGLSDRQRGRRLLDWPDDVAALTDRLGIDRFGIIGYSAGSAYAAACAWAMPERLTGVSAVAGIGPVPRRRDRADLRLNDRVAATLSRRLPFLAVGMFRLVARRMGRDPEWAVRMMMADLNERDVAFVERLYGQWTLAERSAGMLETYRQGPWGVVDDYRVLTAPWGFEVERITVPVHYWHGSDDASCPVRHVQAMADRIPGATLHVWPGEGHVSVAAYAEEFLAPLVAG